jgi:DNA polymerase-1
MDLRELYNTVNPLCEGCSILNKPKPQHCIADYETDETAKADILFLSDCFKTVFGEYLPFRHNEFNLLVDVIDKLEIKHSVCFSAAVKCPNVKEDDMLTEDRNICRNHLYKTIDKVQPKIVFACGNLAFKMITKKSGVHDKRGKGFELETPAGTKTTVVPIFHPYQAIIEPKNRFLFDLDIANAIDSFITKKSESLSLKWELISDPDQLAETKLETITTDIAVDIETTGLNFLTDKINTIAISWRTPTVYRCVVIPVDHKECTLTEQQKIKAFGFIDRVLRNPKNKKILHNSKFDLKFLHRYGITNVVNVWDTKLMQHLVNENLPKSLKDVVGYYYPHELNNL